MVDVRCPMCGKENPAELDVCQYCQARLKPLWSEERLEKPETLNSSQTDGEPGDELGWLSSLRSDTENTAEGDVGEGELPDWLSPQADGQDDLDIGESLEIPDWLNDLPVENKLTPEEDAPAPQGSIDIDISTTDGDENLDQEEFVAEETPEEISGGLDGDEEVETELPDWLAEQEDRERGSDFQEESSSASSAESPGEAWIKDPQESAEIQSPEQELLAEDTIDDDIGAKDIFAKESPAGEVGDQVEAELGQKEPQPQTDNTPDWLLEALGQKDGDSEDEESGWLASLSRDSDDIEIPPLEEPDWLAASDEDVPEVVQSSTQESQQEEGLPEAESQASSEPLPDWLEEALDEEAIPSAVSASQISVNDEEGEVPDFLSDGNLPEWLSNLDSQPESESQESENVPPSDIPDFSDRDEPEEEADVDFRETEASDDISFIEETGEEEEFAGSESELERAELPGWLAEMRSETEEASPPAPSEEPDAERRGPLSGLRGVLPAEQGTTGVEAPPPYLIKLQVSDAQQADVALLEEMLEHEGESQPILLHPVVSSQVVLRILIGLVLIGGILWGLFGGGLPDPLPMPSVETGAAGDLIGNLPPKAPVLLAFDYQPGWSPELDAVSAAVIDHLMLKGARLALVSTYTTGPMQGERVLQMVNKMGGHSYAPGTGYQHLGFLPGGAAGLLAFSLAPTQVTTVGAPDEGLFAGIRSLSDFALAIVITQDPDNARMWIEQVEPALSPTPLMMVVSSQAEPVVLPYLQGQPRQVQGMVAGLLGGVTYERLTGRPKLATAYWASYQLGLLLAALLILVAGFVSILLSALKGRNRRSGGEG